ncbi:MAG TPA: FapA family protein, partial [Nannocystaceae bacterium]|nr:FapA family protein [Nannocystaceae bacterium]
MIDRVHIELGSDEMQAFLHVVEGEPIGADEIRAALTSAAVTYGIDAAELERIAELCRDGAFTCAKVPIAAGRPMQQETSGACELALAVGLQPGHRLEDGSFDYRDRGLLTPVKRGQVVAHCQPAVVGVDGRTVTNRVIPFVKTIATGNPAFGEGLTRDRTGTVVADRDGVVQRADGPVIHIGDHYVHEGDVDIRSGHLEMHGSLTVTGEVTAKFEVQATGDVQIDKAIARGTVYTGGSISVRGGIVGSPRGSVLAEADITGEHAQTAAIRCGGRLHLRRGAVNCELHAARVRIDGPVRGGRVH